MPISLELFSAEHSRIRLRTGNFVIYENCACNLNKASIKIMSQSLPKQELIFDKLAFTLSVPVNDRSKTLKALSNENLKSTFNLRTHRNDNGRYKNNYTFQPYGKSKVFISAYPKKKSDNFIRVEFNPAILSRIEKVKLRDFMIQVLGLKLVKSIYFDCRVTRLDLTVYIYQDYQDIYIYKPSAKRSKIFRDKYRGMLSHIAGSDASDCRVTLYNKTAEQDISDDLYTGAETRLEARLRNLDCSMAELDHTLMENIFSLKFYERYLLDDTRFPDEFSGLVYDSGLNSAFNQHCDSNQRRCYLRYLEDYAFELVDRQQLDFSHVHRESLRFLISKGYKAKLGYRTNG
jgi:hypothetical protein